MFLRKNESMGSWKKRNVVAWDSVPPPSTLEVVFNCCQFTRKDTDVAISFSLQTFTACTGYQENRMINQIGFVQKLKGFYMNTYLRGKEKCWVVSLDFPLPSGETPVWSSI